MKGTRNIGLIAIAVILLIFVAWAVEAEKELPY